MIPRSQAQLLELLREKLATCVKCGACHAFCPVFLEQRREGAGMRGKLALLQAWLAGRSIPPQELLEALEGSLDCYACRAACANAVDIPVIIPLARLLLMPGACEQWSEAMAKPSMTGFPGSPSQPLPKGSILLLAQSSTGQDLSPQLCAVLERRGINAVPFVGATSEKVPVPRRFNLDPIELGTWGASLLQTLGACSPSAFVVSDPTWLHHARLLDALFILSDTEKNLLKGICDLSTFLSGQALPAIQRRSEAWTWHDPCFAARELGIKAQPRKLLSTIFESGCVETAVDGACCGGRGDFNDRVRPIADTLLQTRVAQLSRPGVKTVVTSCGHCVKRLLPPLGQRGIAVKTIPEILLEATA